VLLASALPFDPCLSDVLATFWVGGVLCLAARWEVNGGGLGELLGLGLRSCGGGGLGVTHVLCTPSLWSTLPPSLHRASASASASDSADGASDRCCLEVIALGGEPIPIGTVSNWARRRHHPEDATSDEGPVANDTILNTGDRNGSTGGRTGGNGGGGVRLLATYGVTEACVYQTVGEVFCDLPRRSGNDDGGEVGVPSGETELGCL